MTQHLLQPWALQSPDRMSTLVESCTRFSLDHCELSIYETRKTEHDFRLDFHGFGVTSMLRGKKVLHFEDSPAVEYLPGQSVMMDEGQTMCIDFPEADIHQPTQCTSLVIERSHLQDRLDRLSTSNPDLALPTLEAVGSIRNTIDNTAKVKASSEQMLRVLSGDDPFKELEAEMVVERLILEILRGHYRSSLDNELISTPFGEVRRYIRANLLQDIQISDLCKVADMGRSHFFESFKQHMGITPNQLISEERFSHARRLLTESDLSIKEIAYASGFSDPNYFNRHFKKQSGETPGGFRRRVRAEL